MTSTMTTPMTPQYPVNSVNGPVNGEVSAITPEQMPLFAVPISSDERQRQNEGQNEGQIEGRPGVPVVSASPMVSSMASSISRSMYHNDLEANLVGLRELSRQINNEQPNDGRRITRRTTTHRIRCGGSGIELLGGCIGVLFVIGIFVCAIMWFIYMVKSLCNLSYHDQKDLCPASNVWLYVLLSISLFANLYGITNNMESSSKKSQLICGTIVLLATTSWGCVELFGVPCIDQLYDTLLYTMFTITVLLNMINTAATFTILMLTK